MLYEIKNNKRKPKNQLLAFEPRDSLSLEGFTSKTKDYNENYFLNHTLHEKAAELLPRSARRGREPTASTASDPRPANPKLLVVLQN